LVFGFEANGILIEPLQNKYEDGMKRHAMPPFWPFKRTKKNEDIIDETPPAPIVYRKGQDVHTEKHSKSQERDESAYKDALALFGGGETTVVASTNVADAYDGVSNESPEENPPSFEWVHHSDGYHYKKLSDGQFEPTAYVKNADGSYSEYA